MILRRLFKGDDHSTSMKPPYLYVGFVTADFAAKHGCRTSMDFINNVCDYSHSDAERLIMPMLDDWCRESLSGLWEINNDWIFIEKESDAMLFKLAWCSE